MIVGFHDFWMGWQEIHATMALPALVKFMDMMMNQIKNLSFRSVILRSVMAKDVLLHADAVMRKVEAMA